MSLYTALARNVFLPLGDRVMGTSISRDLQFLEKSQRWSREQQLEYQNEKLRALIRHAYDNVPYYHKIFRERELKPEDFRSVIDLVKLPVITKDIIRRNFEDFKAKNYGEGTYFISRTGGSTGVPLLFYNTLVGWSISWAANFRAFGWGGFNYGDKLVILGGSSLVPDSKTSPKMKIRELVERRIYLTGVHMSPDSMMEYYQIIRRKRPHFIRGYSTSIASFATFLKENDLEIDSIRAAFPTAEMLLDHHRKTIEEVFDCTVYNEYGCRDGNGRANECEHHTGLHSCFELNYTEFLSLEDRDRVTEGERGEVITTDLLNYAMPFIRYAPGDLAVPSDEICPCGRTLPLISSLEGRTTDIITFSNGVTLGGPGMASIFREFNLKEYQLIQKSRNELTINLVKRNNYREEETPEIMKIMQFHCGESVNIEIVFLDEIPREKNSKFKFVISMDCP